jgi:hypothetical protein
MAQACSPLVENISPLVENSYLQGFKEYLVAQKRRNVQQLVLCAKRYDQILQTGDASKLLTISGPMRH